MTKRGFTLLEVLVSLSILALALTALAGINANSFESSNYARYITVGTMLARSKMIDIEMELMKDGFSDDDKELDGDFSEEGYEEMKWRAKVRKVEVDVGQLIGGLLGGDVDAESLPDEMQAFIGALNGEGTGELVEQVEGSELSQILGGGQMELIFKQVGETLSDSIREIRLEIIWGREGIDEESITFVQYVTTSGRIALAPPSAVGIPPQGLTPGGRIPQTATPPRLPDGTRVPALPNPRGGKPCGRIPAEA